MREGLLDCHFFRRRAALSLALILSFPVVWVIGKLRVHKDRVLTISQWSGEIGAVPAMPTKKAARGRGGTAARERLH